MACTIAASASARARGLMMVAAISSARANNSGRAAMACTIAVKALSDVIARRNPHKRDFDSVMVAAISSARANNSGGPPARTIAASASACEPG